MIVEPAVRPNPTAMIGDVVLLRAARRSLDILDRLESLAVAHQDERLVAAARRREEEVRPLFDRAGERTPAWPTTEDRDCQ